MNASLHPRNDFQGFTSALEAVSTGFRCYVSRNVQTVIYYIIQLCSVCVNYSLFWESDASDVRVLLDGLCVACLFPWIHD